MYYISAELSTEPCSDEEPNKRKNKRNNIGFCYRIVMPDMYPASYDAWPASPCSNYMYSNIPTLDAASRTEYTPHKNDTRYPKELNCQ